MSDRIRNGLLCLLALATGGILYGLFRENTIVALQLEKFLPLAFYRELLPKKSFPFLQFYLPDLLWSFSLCCGLLAIFGADRRGSYRSVGSTLALGCFWELMQWLGILSGTGDSIDVLMYSAGCILSILTNYKKERRQ